MRLPWASSRSLLFVVLAASTLGAAFACAGTDDEPLAGRDAGGDASLLNEGAPPDADAEVPLGEVCGDPKGLEENAAWPLRGACPKRAGAFGATGPRSEELQWTLPAPAAESSPAIDSERLVWVGTTAGDLIAISPGGRVQATVRLPGPIKSSPARTAAKLTIIGAADGLYAFDRFGGPLDAGAEAGDAGEDAGVTASSARLAWKRPLAGVASSPVIGGDGTIYVGTTDGKLVAVTGDGSAVKWSATTNDTGGSSPAIATNGTVYVGSTDKKLYAIAPDGAVKWTFDAGASITGSPCVGGDETVYVGATDGKLHAIDPTGKERWSYAAAGPIGGTPAVRAGVVYVGSDDKSLHAVSTVDGKRKWVYATLGEVGTPVIGSDGLVYVGAADGNLYAITPTGSLFWASSLRGRVKGAPALGDDGALYVTSDTGVHALGP